MEGEGYGYDLSEQKLLHEICKKIVESGVLEDEDDTIHLKRLRDTELIFREGYLTKRKHPLLLFTDNLKFKGLCYIL